MKVHDLTGKVFQRLTVIGRAGSCASGATWNCRCACGNTKIVASCNLINQHIKSCGCLNSELSSQRAAHFYSARITHGGVIGGKPSRLYSTWMDMKTRCGNPRLAGYKNYGGRGIKVCARWSDFANFRADMPPHPGPGYSIDRINNDGDYEPGNCRWATAKEQQQNTRRSYANRAKPTCAANV